MRSTKQRRWRFGDAAMPTNEVVETTAPSIPTRAPSGKAPRGLKYERVGEMIRPALTKVRPEVVDAHLRPDADPLWHGKSGAMKDVKNLCKVEKGKAFKPGKLEVGFLSDEQRLVYNKKNPDAPQIDRAGPVMRVCAGPNKPLLIPIRDFAEATKKAKEIRSCIMEYRPPIAECALEKSGYKKLAIAGMRRKTRKGRR